MLDAALRLPSFARGRRIGLYGGSFDPVHEGHAAVAETALKRLRLDAVWWLVSPQNPLKNRDDTADFIERFDRTREFVRHPRMIVTDLERRIGSGCTADTLDALRGVIPLGRFVWIMGADSFAELHSWQRWTVLPDTLPLCVFDRPGHGPNALSSPAATRYARARIGADRAMRLPGRTPPAWSFIAWPLRRESSTALRKRGND